MHRVAVAVSTVSTAGKYILLPIMFSCGIVVYGYMGKMTNGWTKEIITLINKLLVEN